LFRIYRKGIRAVRPNHRQSPENLQLVIRLGDLLLRMGKKGETIEVYGKATEKLVEKNLSRSRMFINK
jgi:predicted negative regulator of RcsB-dependent stress response